MTARALPFETMLIGAPSIGQDLWRQKACRYPHFREHKDLSELRKTAFLVCLDSTPSTGEYRLLQ